MRSASSFTFEPLFVVLGVAALWAYVRAWRRERRTEPVTSSRSRPACS